MITITFESLLENNFTLRQEYIKFQKLKVIKNIEHDDSEKLEIIQMAIEMQKKKIAKMIYQNDLK